MDDATEKTILTVLENENIRMFVTDISAAICRTISYTEQCLLSLRQQGKVNSWQVGIRLAWSAKVDETVQINDLVRRCNDSITDHQSQGGKVTKSLIRECVAEFNYQGVSIEGMKEAIRQLNSVFDPSRAD